MCSSKISLKTTPTGGGAAVSGAHQLSDTADQIVLPPSVGRRHPRHSDGRCIAATTEVAGVSKSSSACRHRYNCRTVPRCTAAARPMTSTVSATDPASAHAHTTRSCITVVQSRDCDLGMCTAQRAYLANTANCLIVYDTFKTRVRTRTHACFESLV